MKFVKAYICIACYYKMRKVREMKKAKKLLAAILCLCTAMMFMSMAALAADLPEGPAVNGDVWTVNPDNAQYVLDGAYGSIDGKTINFGAGTYSDVLVLARPTKYEGSGTKYYNMNWSQETGWVKEDEPLSYEDFIENPSNIVTYEREVKNVTFTADEGVVIPGFASSSGYVYGSAYDYVRDVEIVNTTNSYYGVCSLSGITFSGITVKDSISIANYVQNGDAVNTGIKILDCTFMGDTSKMASNGYAAISLKADSRTFEDIEVSGCKFTNYFQGIYSQGADGIQIKNNVFDGTTHNAIAVQNGASNKVGGEIIIEENIIKNAGDRAIRFGNAAEAERITVQNNVMVDSGDGAGELIKGDFPDSSAVSLEHNYWDGRDVVTAVANEAVRPETTGITGGVFPENVDAYKAQGFVIKDNGDGTFTVESAKDKVTLVNEAGEDQMIEVEAGETISLPVPVWEGHSFKGWYGSDGKPAESYTATLDGTGNVTFTAKWEHNYSGEWKSDENSHWHECVCGDRADTAGHTFKWVTDKEASAGENGSKHEECQICRYKKSPVEIPATGEKPQDKPGTDKPEKPGDTNVPQTGDAEGMAVLIALAVSGAVGAVGVIILSGRRRAK